MDNFRRYNPRSKRPGSTDGFVGGSNPARGAAPNFRRSSAYQPQTNRIGNFKGVDGFSGARPGAQQHPGATLPDPQVAHSSRKPERDHSGKIQLDKRHSKPVKKRRFRLWNPLKKSNWNKRMVLKTAGGLAVIVLLIGGYLGGKAFLKARQIFRGGGGAAALQEDVDPSRLKGEGDGRVNILMLGRGGLGHEGADLTDTIVVASIDPIQKEAALLSIPRDLYVKQPSGGYTKINAVFANAKNKSLTTMSANTANRTQIAEDAGFKAVEEMVSSKMGIPIHYHTMIDFEGFKKAIDTVGGVDVNVGPNDTVREVMTIDNKRYVLDVGQGAQHMDGMKALAYSRSRYASARGDFSRSERQRLVLIALKNKVFSLGTFGNPLKINQLLSDFGNHVQTNMTSNEVKRLYEIGNTIDSGKISSVGLADPPNVYVVTDNINGLSVVVPKAGLDNYKEIQSYVRNRLRDSFLASENATVAILNGTGVAGLATKTADDLKSYGYNVSQVADAPTQNYQTTIVVDLRNGTKKYTKSYLEKRFGAAAVGSLPDPNINPGTADFVIILGQNEQTRLGNR